MIYEVVMENELIKKAKNGDTAAFEQLISQYTTILYNIALRIMGNHEDASDASQEALIRVYRNIGKFKGESKFSTWIYRIAYNACIDEYRKRKSKRGISFISTDDCYEDSENPLLCIADASPTPEESALQRERTKMLYNAIGKLSATSRSTIMLRDVDGLSYEEIAKIQGCSLGTVKSRVNRARTQLKEILLQQKYFQ